MRRRWDDGILEWIGLSRLELALLLGLLLGLVAGLVLALSTMDYR